MKHYLSFGGGVNSVALYLLMEDLGMEFEAVFVDHGGDWPETYEYVDYFIGTGRPVTVLKPEFRGCSTLLEFCKKYRMTPNVMRRWCTAGFKVMPFNSYVDSPCFVHVGIDAGEIKRAKVSCEEGMEKRYLLIEHGLDRDGCKGLIKKHGLMVPLKSGCWFCPFQRVGQWRKLRRVHPDLFCAARQLEDEQNEARAERGKPPYYIRGENKPLSSLVNEAEENQKALPGMEEFEYPPCQCGL